MKKTSFLNHLGFFVIAISILGFSSIPIWLGRQAETDSLVFRGTYVDTADYAVHIAMMQAGRLGEWAYQLRFTSEEHAPAFIRLFYILLGHISRVLRLDVETVYHAARWIFGFTALFAIDRLFQKIFSSKTPARFTFFLAVFGAGIGWLQLILGVPLEPISPIDLWLIDAYILFSMALFPSFSLMLALMAAGLHFFLLFLEDGNWKHIVWVGSLAITSQLFNPIAFAVIDLSMVGAVLFHWWRNKKANFKQGYALLILTFVQMPLFAYNLLILARDPFWSRFTLQNETLSPPPIFYVWGFAPFWLFAIIGIIRSIREQNPTMGAMSTWVISGFVMAYLPVLIQRRFLLGITIPLAVLAIYGFQYLETKLPIALQALKKRENLLRFTYVLLASISSLFLTLNSSLYVLGHPSNLYYPRDLEAAIQWLDNNSSPNDFVLAEVQTSQILAQKTHLKVYVGHEMETLYFHNKEAVMQAYFNGTISDEWLSQTPIRWVIYGPYESEIASSFQPSLSLEPVYQNESVKIYKVIQ